MKYGSMMSRPRGVKRSASRMCSMLASDPVSRLSTQTTRLPRASSSSQRCEPRKPAPPVTRHVATRRRIPEDRSDKEPCRRAGAVHITHAMASADPAEPERDDEHDLTVAPIVGPDDPRRFTDSG